ncbi:MAG: amidohydrolase family protein [Pirellulaceae bacterium]
MNPMPTHLVTDRRNFHRTALASGLLVMRPALADDKTKMVIDTHLHCFAGAGDARFPYHPQAPYEPPQAATPQHLLTCMDDAGVDFAIVVHPEPYQGDHRYLDYCLDVGAGRLKGTCLFFADRPDSLRQMPEYLKRNDGKIVAARLHAYAPDRLPPFGKPELRQLWRIATEHGVAVQLHLEPRYAERLEPYIDEFRETTVIIDHLGRPMQGTPDEHETVVRWSDKPNTIMKIAALPEQTAYPHRDVAPIIRRLTTVYGPQRVIYGGGFGADATGASYRAYRERVAGYLEHLNETEQALVLGKNAARIFSFQ